MSGEVILGVWQFLSLAASAGVFGAMFTATFGWWTSRQEKRAKARHLALQLSVILEHYGWEIARKLYAHDNYISSNGYVGEDFTYVPPVPVYPEPEEVWPTLAPDLTDRALTLRLDVDQANIEQKETYYYLDEDGEEYALRDAAEFAHRAVILSRDLRYRYELARTKSAERLLEIAVDFRAKYPKPAQ